MKPNNFGGVPTGVGGSGGGGTGGSAGGDLSGTLPGPTVIGIDGIPIAAPGTEAGGDTLVYNAGTGEWDFAPGGGGGASPLTTKGDLYGYSTVDDRVPVGVDGDVLVADSTDAQGVSWQSPTLVSRTGTEIDYVAFTAPVSVTATAEASANTVVASSSKTYDGSTAIYVEFFAPAVRPASTAAAYVALLLYEDATLLGWYGAPQTPAASFNQSVGWISRKVTPSAGAHVYTVKAIVSSGTGTVQAGTGGTGTYGNGFIRITRAIAAQLTANSGTELNYVEFTANVSVSATTEGTANTVVTGSSITLDGNTTVVVEFFSSQSRPTGTAAAQLIFVLFDGATVLGTFGVQNSPAANNAYEPVLLSRRIATPSAGAHQYIVKAYVTSGTGLVVGGAGGTGVNLPGYIRVTRVDPAPTSAVPAKHWARVYNSTNEALNNSTDTFLTFDSERFDTDGYHSTSSNTGRLTVPAGLAGLYHIVFHGYTTGTPGSGSNAGIRLNGTTGIAIGALQSTDTSVGGYMVSTLYELAVGDYVEAKLRVQAASKNMIFDANASGEFMMTLIQASAVPAVVPSILGVAQYIPGSQQIYSTTSATFADIDATNLAVTFTAPASGNVLVTTALWVDGSASTLRGHLGLRESTTDIGTPVTVARDAEAGYLVTARWYLTGVTAGAHTYKLSFARATTGTFRVIVHNGAVGNFPAAMITVDSA